MLVYEVKVTMPIELTYRVEGYEDEESAKQRAKEYLFEDLRDRWFVYDYGFIDLVKTEVVGKEEEEQE